MADTTALDTFANLTNAKPIDDDGYEEGKSKERELPVKMDDKGNELFETPPHGRTLEETYPGMFRNESNALAPKKYNPPK